MYVITLRRKDMRFAVSTTVSTFVSMALSRIPHFEAQIPKTLCTTRRARDSLQLNIALLLSNVLLLYGYMLEDTLRHQQKCEVM
jgi:hypothetical protein